MKSGFGRAFATCTFAALLMLNGFILLWGWDRRPIPTGFLFFINALAASAIAVNHIAYRHLLARAKGVLWSVGKILLVIIQAIALFTFLFEAVGIRDPIGILFPLLIWFAVCLCFSVPVSIMGNRVTQTELNSFPRQRVINVYHVIGLAGTLGILVIMILLGGADGFTNIPIALITYGLTFFVLLAIFKKDFLGFIPDSLLSLVSSPLSHSSRYADIAATGARVCVGAATIGVLIGFVQMLRALDDPSALGLGLATLTLNMLYGIAGGELYFFSLHKIYAEPNKDTASHPAIPLNNLELPFMALMLVFILCLFMLTAFSTS